MRSARVLGFMAAGPAAWGSARTPCRPHRSADKVRASGFRDRPPAPPPARRSARTFRGPWTRRLGPFRGGWSCPGLPLDRRNFWHQSAELRRHSPPGPDVVRLVHGAVSHRDFGQRPAEPEEAAIVVGAYVGRLAVIPDNEADGGD